MYLIYRSCHAIYHLKNTSQKRIHSNRNFIERINHYRSIDQRARQKLSRVQTLVNQIEEYSVLSSYKFLVFCDESAMACQYEDFQIYEISTIYFLSYASEEVIRKCQNRKTIYGKQHQLKSILQYGFYFSYEYNLTQSYARQQQEKFHSNFTWNQKLLQELKEQKVNSCWMTPIIQGFVGQFTYTCQNRRIQYLLISRRSMQYSGTQFFCSGINQNGYVANFVDTEQIIRIDDLIMVDEQIRGSAPVFYTNKGNISMQYQQETNYQAFLKHIQKIKTRFSRIFCLNLLSKSKQQGSIIKQYENCIKKLINTDNKVKYYHFNYYKSASQISNEIHKCIDALADMKLNLGYIVGIKNNSGNVVHLKDPNGIVRTNCIDCTEKTSLFQMLLALLTFQDMLSIVNIKFMTSLVYQYFNEAQSSMKNQLVGKFVELWEKNKKKLCYHYRGQQYPTKKTQPNSPVTILNKALSKSATRCRISRKLSIVYPLCSFQIHQMFMIDILLGTKKVQSTLRQSNYSNLSESNFAKKQIKTAIITWKIKQQVFHANEIKIPNVDILVVGLQGVDTKVLTSFKESLSFQKGNQLEMIIQQIWKGNAILVYSNQQMKCQLTNNIQKACATPEQDNAIQASKSAVYTRLRIGNHSVCFVSVDLGSRKNMSKDKKISLLKSVHAKAFQNKSHTKRDNNLNIYSDDAMFLFGNLQTTNEKMGNNMVKSLNIISQSKPTFSKLNRNAQSINFNHARQSSSVSVQQLINNPEYFRILSQSLMQQRQYCQEPLTFNRNSCGEKAVFNKNLSQVGKIWYSTQNSIIWEKYEVFLLPGHESAPTIGILSLKFPNQQPRYSLISPKLQEDELNYDQPDPLISPVDSDGNIFSDSYKQNFSKYFDTSGGLTSPRGRIKRHQSNYCNKLFTVDEQNEEIRQSQQSKIQDQR